MLQFTQAHQNRTIEDWKNVPRSDMSGSHLQHLDCLARMWYKLHENISHSILGTPTSQQNVSNTLFKVCHQE